MKEATSREKVLKKIRDALATVAEPPFSEPGRNGDLYRKESEDIPEVLFVKAFKELGGEFTYCADEKEFCQQLASVLVTFSLKELFCNDSYLTGLLRKNGIQFVSDVKSLDACECSLTRCESLIARTGSVIVSADNDQLRSVYFTSPIHFVLAYTSQMVDDIPDAFKSVITKKESIPRFLSIITGPSRTADIEKTLVMGAHGPKELVLFLIDDLA